MYRFNFPKIFHSIFNVNKKFNPCWLIFALVYNDLLLNNYNSIFIIEWLTNVGVNFCTNQKAVLYYMIKYCVKAETKIAKLNKFMKSIFSHIFSKNFMSLLMIKFINKLIREKYICTRNVPLFSRPKLNQSISFS